MKTNETNLAKVRNALNSGLRLTVLSAISICSTVDLRKYVSMLRKEGLNIQNEWVQKGNKSYKVYWLKSKNNTCVNESKALNLNMEARQLKLLIKEKGIKQTFIAERLKVSKALVTQWISGVRPIADHHLLELKRILS